MTDSYRDLIQATISALKGNAPLTGVVGQRIYTDVPDNETFPYVVVRMSSIDYSTKETPGMEHTIQISAFSRETSLNQVTDIRQKIYNVLNRNEAGLSSASVSNIIFNGISDVFKDPDGQTWQSVIQFRAVIL